MSLISYFPSPLPNEDFRSILYRYHIVTFNNNISKTNRELFEAGSEFFTVFPRAMNKLLNKFPLSSKYDMQTLINQNTLLPIFLPFIAHDHRENILNEVANGGGQSESRVGRLVGNKYVRCISNMIKYCPLCMKEDDESFGCSYIHREHQFSFIYTCNKHKAKLISHCMECGIELEYSPLHSKCKNGHWICSNYSGVSILEDLLESELQHDLEYIIKNSEKLNDALIKQRFLEYLAVKGYATKKFIKCQELSKDLIHYYSEKTIVKMGLNIDYMTKH
ncbi:TniQ family protein, partial [Paenibacillus alvei]